MTINRYNHDNIDIKLRIPTNKISVIEIAVKAAPRSSSANCKCATPVSPTGEKEFSLPYSYKYKMNL